MTIISPARSEIKSFEFEEVVYSFEDSSFCKPEPNSPFDRLFKSLDKVSANVNNNFPTVFRLAACEAGNTSKTGSIVKPYMYIKRYPLPAKYQKLSDAIKSHAIPDANLFSFIKLLFKREVAQSYTFEQKEDLRKLLQSRENAGLLSAEISKMSIFEDNQNRFIASSIIETDAATSIALMHPAVAKGTVFTIYLSIPTGFGYDLDTYTDLLHRWATTLKVKNSTPQPTYPQTNLMFLNELRARVSKCWVIDIGSEAGNTTVTVRFKLGMDGMVQPGSIRLIGSNAAKDSSEKPAFQTARRAILRCQKGGYALPQNFDQSGYIEIEFDPTIRKR